MPSCVAPSGFPILGIQGTPFTVAHVTVTVRLFGPKSNRLIIQKSVGWSDSGDTPLTVTVLAVVPLAVPKGVTVRGKPCI